MELTYDYKFNLTQPIHVEKVDEHYVIIFKDTHKYIVVDQQGHEIFQKLRDNKSVGETFEDLQLKEKETEYTDLLSDIYWGNSNTQMKSKIDPNQMEIKFDITYQCNTKCSHCFLPEFKEMNENEIDISRWKKICDKIFDNIEYKPFLCISGGEALLFPDKVRELIEYVYPKVESIALLTNGFVISDWIEQKNQDMLDFFVSHIETFQISLDGYDEETYEKIRGKGNYRRLLNTIKYLNSIKKPMSLHATVSQENMKEIEDHFLEFVQEHDLYGKGKNHFSFSLVRPLGRGRDLEKNNQIVSGPEFEHFLTRMQKAINQIYPPNLMKTDDIISGTICSAARQISVAPNGLCYLCGISSGEPLCNILEEDFQEIVERYKKLREAMDQKHMEICSDCELKGFCFGHCRVINKIDTGSYTNTICGKEEKEEFYRLMVREKTVGVPY